MSWTRRGAAGILVLATIPLLACPPAVAADTDPRPVHGGTNFATAAELPLGISTDTLRAAQPGFYRINLAKGQRLHVSAKVPARDAPVTATLYSADHKPCGDNTEDGLAVGAVGPSAVAAIMATPVGGRTCPKEAGTYYVQLLFGGRSTPVTITAAVDDASGTSLPAPADQGLVRPADLDTSGKTTAITAGTADDIGDTLTDGLFAAEAKPGALNYHRVDLDYGQSLSYEIDVDPAVLTGAERVLTWLVNPMGQRVNLTTGGTATDLTTGAVVVNAAAPDVAVVTPGPARYRNDEAAGDLRAMSMEGAYAIVVGVDYAGTGTKPVPYKLALRRTGEVEAPHASSNDTPWLPVIGAACVFLAVAVAIGPAVRNRHS